ncbi:MAG: 3-hydroxyacyl-CoA dehydrogenase NAD-binding domain-containing protein [Desulfomonilia bacterium]|jgi:3-hydroxyacyl-CoA dehydrogenase/enoyl-CoA hydratase/carnithine racemase|nr:3-hydroxyacyl-CoA dehydrogenase NAD-binding domain-containing protein [Deltaproteobacteria bacterium]MDX9760569.1 3-hydroxyacyl-CoA dehydrogenase NAD-binding domain-containing protein [Desulfomonilia bacterium]
MAKYIMTCKLNFYESKKAGKIAIVTMDNGQSYNVPNTWGFEAFESLNKVLDIVESDPDVKGWLLVGKPFIFNVGADIMSVDPGMSRDDAVQIGRMGHSSFKRIMDLKIPTLAAINGAAMGGGVEVGLYHDYRTISKSPGGCDHYALPECFLGLVPGWGGTQLVTKLAGPEVAIQLIITNPLNMNAMINSKKAFEMGLADRLIAPIEFVDDSIRLLENIITGEEKIERKKIDPKMSDELYNNTKFAVLGRVHSGAMAPYRALDLIKGAADWSLDEGFEQENQTLADMIKSRQFLSSVYSFDLTQRRAKKLPGRPPKEVKGYGINKIGVIGAGLMASQMALLFAQRFQCPVIMKDIKQEFVDKGLAYVREQLGKRAKKGRMSAADARWMGEDLITGTVTYDGFEDCDFVIEAVFEEIGIKQKVFGELEEVCKPECLFLTNTSSLDISEMAKFLKDPSRVVGFHFFNPIAVLPLVEIIKAEKTSEVVLATAFDIAKRIKKTPVLVKNAPAFLVNRILLAWMDGIFQCIDEGADFMQVDNAVVDLGFPMSPFTLAGLVGPAIALHVQETLNASWPERFPVSGGLKNLVTKGKKQLLTFTDTGIDVDPEIKQGWPQGSKSFTDQEIKDRVLMRVAQEIDLILKEGVVASPKDVDTGVIMGAGWPFFMGGITPYLDQMGYSEKACGRKFHPQGLLEKE